MHACEPRALRVKTACDWRRTWEVTSGPGIARLRTVSRERREKQPGWKWMPANIPFVPYLKGRWKCRDFFTELWSSNVRNLQSWIPSWAVTHSCHLHPRALPATYAELSTGFPRQFILKTMHEDRRDSYTMYKMAAFFNNLSKKLVKLQLQEIYIQHPNILQWVAEICMNTSFHGGLRAFNF